MPRLQGSSGRKLILRRGGWGVMETNKHRGLLGLFCRFAPRVTQACSSRRLSSPHGDFPLSGATAALDLWGTVHRKENLPGRMQCPARGRTVPCCLNGVYHQAAKGRSQESPGEQHVGGAGWQVGAQRENLASASGNLEFEW